MLRQARLDAPGTLHHVVIRGIERGRIVEDDQDRRSFVSRLSNLAQETETSIYAWSLMTNHAHMLLRGGPSGLPKFMRRLLTGYAVTYNLRSGGRVCFGEVKIYRGEDCWVIVKVLPAMVNVPVRALPLLLASRK
jgi:REP element-mobilizing transposase RayT